MPLSGWSLPLLVPAILLLAVAAACLCAGVVRLYRTLRRDHAGNPNRKETP